MYIVNERVSFISRSYLILLQELRKKNIKMKKKQQNVQMWSNYCACNLSTKLHC